MSISTEMQRKMGGFRKVKNMIGSKGNPVRNQFVLFFESAVAFQSYETLIAVKVGGMVYLDEGSWDCSVTTGKYRNIFLGDNKQGIQRKIDSGEYRLIDLNRD